MKLSKILLSALCAASLGVMFSACDNSRTVSNSAANNANLSNTMTVVNSNRTAENITPGGANTVNTAPPANPTAAKPNPAGRSIDEANISGELQTGKTESLILYVGMETGDYAAYCFDNDSEAGRAISAVCKRGDQCEVNGETAPGKCRVPGLEADLAESARIVKVISARSLGPRKRPK